MKKLTCCFTGHRTIYKNDQSTIRQRLAFEIENLIINGIIYFGVGGAIGFDMLAAECVLELKEKYKNIRLILVLPCEDSDKYWKNEDKLKLVYIKENADKIIYTSKEYKKGCMQIRNRHLVDHSEVCVAYIRRGTGGTAYTVNYAIKNNNKIIKV